MMMGIIIFFAQSYTITFNTHGGEIVRDVKVSRSQITLPEPVRPGWTFTGWYTSEEPTANAKPLIKSPRKSGTLHAQWEQTTFVLSFFSEGEEVRNVAGDAVQLGYRESMPLNNETMTDASLYKPFFVMEPSPSSPHAYFEGWEFKDLNGNPAWLWYNKDNVSRTETKVAIDPKTREAWPLWAGEWALEYFDPDLDGINAEFSPIKGVYTVKYLREAGNDFLPLLYDSSLHAIWQYHKIEVHAFGSLGVIENITSGNVTGARWISEHGGKVLQYGDTIRSNGTGETLRQDWYNANPASVVGWRVGVRSDGSNKSLLRVVNDIVVESSPTSLSRAQLQHINELYAKIYPTTEDFFIDPLFAYLAHQTTQNGHRLFLYPVLSDGAGASTFFDARYSRVTGNSSPIRIVDNSDKFLVSMPPARPLETFLGYYYYTQSAAGRGDWVRREISRQQIENGTDVRGGLTGVLVDISLFHPSRPTIFHEDWYKAGITVSFNFGKKASVNRRGHFDDGVRRIADIDFGVNDGEIKGRFTDADPSGNLNEESSDLIYKWPVVNVGDVIVLPSASMMARSGLHFVGWQEVGTSGQQSGRIFPAGFEYTIPSEFGSAYTMQAVWSDAMVNFSFNLGGGRGLRQDEVDKMRGKYGDRVQIPTAPSRFGYDFLGWRTSYTGDTTLYSSTNQITVQATKQILTAQWKAKPVTVKLDYSFMDSEDLIAREPLTVSTNPDGSALTFDQTVRLRDVPANDFEFNQRYTLVGWTFNAGTPHAMSVAVTRFPSSGGVNPGTVNLNQKIVTDDGSGNLVAYATKDSLSKTVEFEYFKPHYISGDMARIGATRFPVTGSTVPVTDSEVSSLLNAFDAHINNTHFLSGFLAVPRDMADSLGAQLGTVFSEHFMDPATGTYKGGTYEGFEVAYVDIANGYMTYKGTSERFRIPENMNFYAALQPNLTELRFFDAEGSRTATVQSYYDDGKLPTRSSVIDLNSDVNQGKVPSGLAHTFFGWQIEYWQTGAAAPFKTQYVDSSLLFSSGTNSATLLLMNSLHEGRPANYIAIKPDVMSPTQFRYQIEINEGGFVDTFILDVRKESQHTIILAGQSYIGGTVNLLEEDIMSFDPSRGARLNGHGITLAQYMADNFMVFPSFDQFDVGGKGGPAISWRSGIVLDAANTSSQFDVRNGRVKLHANIKFRENRLRIWGGWENQATDAPLLDILDFSAGSQKSLSITVPSTNAKRSDLIGYYVDQRADAPGLTVRNLSYDNYFDPANIGFTRQQRMNKAAESGNGFRLDGMYRLGSGANDILPSPTDAIDLYLVWLPRDVIINYRGEHASDAYVSQPYERFAANKTGSLVTQLAADVLGWRKDGYRRAGWSAIPAGTTDDFQFGQTAVSLADMLGKNAIATPNEADITQLNVQLYVHWQVTKARTITIQLIPDDWGDDVTSFNVLVDRTNVFPQGVPGAWVHDEQNKTLTLDGSFEFGRPIPGLGWVTGGDDGDSDDTKVFTLYDGDLEPQMVFAGYKYKDRTGVWRNLDIPAEAFTNQGYGGEITWSLWLDDDKFLDNAGHLMEDITLGIRWIPTHTDLMDFKGAEEAVEQMWEVLYVPQQLTTIGSVEPVTLNKVNYVLAHDQYRCPVQGCECKCTGEIGNCPTPSECGFSCVHCITCGHYQYNHVNVQGKTDHPQFRRTEVVAQRVEYAVDLFGVKKLQAVGAPQALALNPMYETVEYALRWSYDPNSSDPSDPPPYFGNNSRLGEDNRPVIERGDILTRWAIQNIAPDPDNKKIDDADPGNPNDYYAMNGSASPVSMSNPAVASLAQTISERFNISIPLWSRYRSGTGANIFGGDPSQGFTVTESQMNTFINSMNVPGNLAREGYDLVGFAIQDQFNNFVAHGISDDRIDDGDGGFISAGSNTNGGYFNFFDLNTYEGERSRYDNNYMFTDLLQSAVKMVPIYRPHVVTLTFDASLGTGGRITQQRTRYTDVYFADGSIERLERLTTCLINDRAQCADCNNPLIGLGAPHPFKIDYYYDEIISLPYLDTRGFHKNPLLDTNAWFESWRLRPRGQSDTDYIFGEPRPDMVIQPGGVQSAARFHVTGENASTPFRASWVSGMGNGGAQPMEINFHVVVPEHRESPFNTRADGEWNIELVNFGADRINQIANADLHRDPLCANPATRCEWPNLRPGCLAERDAYGEYEDELGQSGEFMNTEMGSSAMHRRKPVLNQNGVYTWDIDKAPLSPYYIPGLDASSTSINNLNTNLDADFAFNVQFNKTSLGNPRCVNRTKGSDGTITPCYGCSQCDGWNGWFRQGELGYNGYGLDAVGWYMEYEDSGTPFRPDGTLTQRYENGRVDSFMEFDQVTSSWKVSELTHSFAPELSSINVYLVYDWTRGSVTFDLNNPENPSIHSVDNLAQHTFPVDLPTNVAHNTHANKTFFGWTKELALGNMRSHVATPEKAMELVGTPAWNTWLENDFVKVQNNCPDDSCRPAGTCVSNHASAIYRKTENNTLEFIKVYWTGTSGDGKAPYTEFVYDEESAGVVMHAVWEDHLVVHRYIDGSLPAATRDQTPIWDPSIGTANMYRTVPGSTPLPNGIIHATKFLNNNDYGGDFNVALPIPTKQGYRFRHWSLTPNGAPVDTHLEVAPGETIKTLYAVWDIYWYAIEFDANNDGARGWELADGTSGDMRLVNPGKQMIYNHKVITEFNTGLVIPENIREHFDPPTGLSSSFLGWTPDGGATRIDTITGSGNKTIVFGDVMSNVGGSQTVNVGHLGHQGNLVYSQTMANPQDPLDSAGDPKFIDGKWVRTVRLFALWDNNTFNVRYLDDGSTVHEQDAYLFNEARTATGSDTGFALVTPSSNSNRNDYMKYGFMIADESVMETRVTARYNQLGNREVFAGWYMRTPAAFARMYYPGDFLDANITGSVELEAVWLEWNSESLATANTNVGLHRCGPQLTDCPCILVLPATSQSTWNNGTFEITNPYVKTLVLPGMNGGVLAEGRLIAHNGVSRIILPSVGSLTLQPQSICSATLTQLYLGDNLTVSGNPVAGRAVIAQSGTSRGQITIQSAMTAYLVRQGAMRVTPNLAVGGINVEFADKDTIYSDEPHQSNYFKGHTNYRSKKFAYLENLALPSESRFIPLYSIGEGTLWAYPGAASSVALSPSVRTIQSYAFAYMANMPASDNAADALFAVVDNGIAMTLRSRAIFHTNARVIRLPIAASTIADDAISGYQPELRNVLFGETGSTASTNANVSGNIVYHGTGSSTVMYALRHNVAGNAFTIPNSVTKVNPFALSSVYVGLTAGNNVTHLTVNAAITGGLNAAHFQEVDALGNPVQEIGQHSRYLAQITIGANANALQFDHRIIRNATAMTKMNINRSDATLANFTADALEFPIFVADAAWLTGYNNSGSWRYLTVTNTYGTNYRMQTETKTVNYRAAESGAGASITSSRSHDFGSSMTVNPSTTFTDPLNQGRLFVGWRVSCDTGNSINNRTYLPDWNFNVAMRNSVAAVNQTRGAAHLNETIYIQSSITLTAQWREPKIQFLDKNGARIPNVDILVHDGGTFRSTPATDAELAGTRIWGLGPSDFTLYEYGELVLDDTLRFALTGTRSNRTATIPGAGINENHNYEFVGWRTGYTSIVGPTTQTVWKWGDVATAARHLPAGSPDGAPSGLGTVQIKLTTSPIYYHALYDISSAGQSGSLTFSASSQGASVRAGDRSINGNIGIPVAVQDILVAGAPNRGFMLNVTHIDDDAFRNLTGTRERVHIGSAVERIGNFAFFGSKTTTSVTFGHAAIAYPLGIGNYAFGEMSGLTSIILPLSTQTIGNYAFVDCTKLTSVGLQQHTGLSTIGDAAFWGCTSLIGAFSIPSSVTSIGVNAFGRTRITAFTDGNISFDTGVFYVVGGNLLFRESATSRHLIMHAPGRGDTVIQESTFNNVEHIALNAFAHSRTVTSITIPSHIRSIGRVAGRTSGSPVANGGAFTGNQRIEMITFTGSRTIPTGADGIHNGAATATWNPFVGMDSDLKIQLPSTASLHLSTWANTYQLPGTFII